MPLMPSGDVQIYYELIDSTEPWRAGPPPVVFIHGLGGNQRFWLYQVPAFCGRYPTITVDLRGHGRSGKPAADFSMADMARDVVRLLRALGAERAHIVGLSLGGMVAQQFALDYPLATASLVLADTTCGVPAEYQQIVRDALTFIETHSMAEIAAARITNAFSDGVDPVMREYWIDQVARNDKRAYTCAARAAHGFSVADRLTEIIAPTLVLVGEADRVTPPPLSQDIANRIAGAVFARIPGGHITNLEQPQEFNRVVLEFLATL